MKKIRFIPLTLIILLILFPKIAINGAVQGLNIWVNNVFPSLFPFAVLSGMLVSCGVLKHIEKIFYPLTKHVNLPQSSSQAIAIGIVSGYPMGGIMARDLFIRGNINSEQAELTAAISSFCSPIFIIGSVGVAILENINSGIVILVAHYISYVVTLFVLGLLIKKQPIKIIDDNVFKTTENFGMLLKSSVDKASSALISVCGYIILFSVIKSYIESIPVSDTFVTLISSVMEVSSGCAKIAESGFSLYVKTALSAFAVSWGGLCVIMQISGFVSECDGKNGRILLFKLAHGFLSAVIALFISHIFNFC